MDRAGAARGLQKVLGAGDAGLRALPLAHRQRSTKTAVLQTTVNSRFGPSSCSLQGPASSRRLKKVVASSPMNVHLSLGPCPQSLECRQAEGWAKFPSTSCLPPTGPAKSHGARPGKWALRNPWLRRELSDPKQAEPVLPALQGSQDPSLTLPPKGLARRVTLENTAPLKPSWLFGRHRGLKAPCEQAQAPTHVSHCCPAREPADATSLLNNVNDVGPAGR